jgi:hypothetical protein
LFFDTPDWHEDAECAKVENADKLDKFFANKPSQQWEAKKLSDVKADPNKFFTEGEESVQQNNA